MSSTLDYKVNIFLPLDCRFNILNKQVVKNEKDGQKTVPIIQISGFVS